MSSAGGYWINSSCNLYNNTRTSAARTQDIFNFKAIEPSVSTFSITTDKTLYIAGLKCFVFLKHLLCYICSSIIPI